MTRCLIGAKGVRCLNTRSKSLRRRIVDSQRPVILPARIEFFENDHKNRKHQRCAILADGLKQFIEAIPIVVDARAAKPTGSRPTTACQHGPCKDDRQSESDSLVEQFAHTGAKLGNATDQWNAGRDCRMTFRIGSRQPLSFVMLRRLGFRRMLSLRSSAGVFTLSNPLSASMR